MRSLEYPFSWTWVVASAVMAGFSIVFATVLLIGEEPREFSFSTFTFLIHPLLLYFIFTSILTIAMLFLKFYLYSTKEETPERNLFENEQKTQSSLRRWSLIIALLLTIAALFLPLILSYFLEPLWSLLTISSIVPAVSVPEIILYFYSRSRRD